MKSLVRICVAGLLIAGCSKKGGGDKDNAAPTPPAGSGAATNAVVAPEPPAKPPAPAAELKGESRVVNLIKDEAGKPMAIDVWGRRSFKYGPMQFAKDVAYGQATPHFGVAKGTVTVVVAAGAGDSAKEVGSVSAAQDGEEVTTVLFRDKGGNVSGIVMGMKPPGNYNAPEPPAAGKGLIYVYAGPLRAVEDKLTDKYGGSSFYVGNGTTTCLRQRLEDQGKQPAILGGTNTTQHEVAPGKTKVTLHKWQPGKDCTTPAVADFEVDVADGKGTFVILHSPDGANIEALQIPMWK